MRLPVPRDLLTVLERSTVSVEHLLNAVPRLVGLLDDADRLLQRAGRLLDDIDGTRRNADAVVARTDAVVTRADAALDQVEPFNERLARLLDGLEPSLTRLQPVLERLADTTDPHEVDAMVQLIDQLPRVADKMEKDVLPILDSMNSVAPDLHDLLAVSRELNAMLAQVPGISRMKKRIDEEQAAEDQRRGL
jgi:ABC-type transporter Mla subunit MlaD